MAQERAGSDRVKEVGHHLQTDHQALDVQVRAVAAQLGVQLPNEPTAEQKGWLAELSARRAPTRTAPSPTGCARARQGLRDRRRRPRRHPQRHHPGVRADRHHRGDEAHDVVESIGLVNYEALPTQRHRRSRRPRRGWAQIIHWHQPQSGWLVLGIALIAGLVTAARVVRPR